MVALVTAIFLQIQILRLESDKKRQSECADAGLLYDLPRRGAVEILVDGR